MGPGRILEYTARRLFGNGRDPIHDVDADRYEEEERAQRRHASRVYAKNDGRRGW